MENALEDPRQNGGDGGSQDVTDDRVHFADGGQGCAFVIVEGQFRRHGIIRHAAHGVECIEQQEGDQHCQESLDPGQPCGNGEHQPGCQPERDGSHEHPGAAAPPAGLRFI